MKKDKCVWCGKNDAEVMMIDPNNLLKEVQSCKYCEKWVYEMLKMDMECFIAHRQGKDTKPIFEKYGFKEEVSE